MSQHWEKYRTWLQPRTRAAQYGYALCASILWVLFLTDYLYPKHWQAYGNNDYDLTYASLEVPRRTWICYGQVPMYNPYSAAGTDLMANPQSVHWGIFFLPSLLVGSFYGFKLAILCGYLLGIWGATALFLRLNKPLATALAGGMAWVSIPFFAYHILYAGHLNALYLFLLPWLMYGIVDFIQQKGQLSFGAWAISLLVWLQWLLGGTSYVLIYGTMFWAICVSVLWWMHRKEIPWHTWLRYGLLTAGVAIGASIWKLYPSWMYMQAYPRPFHDITRVSIVGYMQMLVGAAPENESHSLTYWSWHEHAIGGGWLALLVLIAYIGYWKKILGKSAVLWGAALILMLWFSMGNTPNYVNPWYLLNTYFPVFDNLRVPYRAAIFPVSLLMFGWMLLFAAKQHEHPLWRVLFSAMIIQQSLMTLGVAANYRLSPTIDTIQPAVHTQQHFAQVWLPDSLVSDRNHKPTQMYPYLKANIAVANTYEPLPVSRIDTALAQHFIVKGGVLSSFSPNEWKFTQCADTLVIGQRFSTGWRIAQGSGRIISTNGMLAITKPSAALVLRFQSPYLREALWVSVPFWVLILMIGFGLRRKTMT